MRVLTVIPITNNQRLDELTYFSLKDVPLGAVVNIDIRNKIVPALVVKSSDATDMKAILRGGNFVLKRLGATTPRELFTPAFIKAAEYTARYYATTVGSIIFSMVPSAVLSCHDIKIKKKIDTYKKHTHDAYALQVSIDDRITMYKNIARESLARGNSIVIVTPNAIIADKLYTEISNGIEDKSFILHSKMSKKKILKTVSKLSSSEKPVLLVATAKFATINMLNIGTVVIEDEASTAYNTLKRPYLNSVVFLAQYAKRLRVKLILAGTVLSSQVHLSMRNGKTSELVPLSLRQRSEVAVEIIDARRDVEKDEIKETKKTQPFNPIDEKLKKLIEKALKKKQKILILTQRNGLAPITICRDCNSTVTCKKCEAPVALHKKTSGDREFLCGKCGLSSDSDTTCSYCNSWRLDSIGIGIELVEDAVNNLYKKAKIVRIDKKTTKTDKAVKDSVEEFYKNGDILLATQLVMPFINTVDLSVIISLDAMLSVPSFNIDERVFSLLLKVKDITKCTMLIQTRMPERVALTLAAVGDISDFMRNELELRKSLKYPPYTVMIKITSYGSKKQIIENFQNIMPKLEPYGPRVFKQFRRISSGKFALHALLRIETDKWPNDELVELLKNIQPLFEVKVNVE
ncbi:MAG: hypothetical protein LRZ97_00220 [Candidatus Pacebacteria bacterium]|nr:hypothetical protein [Candidatus Paceibacterota bacterium]